MHRSERIKVACLGIAAAAALAAGFAAPRIAQDPGYHEFADARRIGGVPNFWNVASNLPFLWVGAHGVLLLRRRAAFLDPREKASWAAAFGGLALVAAGSGYYHWRPGDETLFWDRLPMALVFVSVLAATVGERIAPAAGMWLLGPLLLGGGASVIHWHLRADLSFYILAQYGSLAAVAALAMLFPARYTRGFDLALATGVYLLAKACEILDGPIYSLGGLLSGHTLKHLLSAAAAALVLRMIRRRVPRASANSLSAVPFGG